MPPPDRERRPVAGAPSKSSTTDLEPEDSATGEVLAEIHGGQRRAAHWLRRVLTEVGT